MTTYRVQWSEIVTADSPEKAADQALSILQADVADVLTYERKPAEIFEIEEQPWNEPGQRAGAE